MEQENKPTEKKSPVFWIIMFAILIISAGVAYGVLSNNSIGELPSIKDSENAGQSQPTKTSSTADAKTYNISYTDSCFDPETTTINQGDTVVFTNNSSTKMWPASDNHPSHTKYPEFDAEKSIPEGETYSFTFDKSGTWGMHDHNKSSCEGTITVN